MVNRAHPPRPKLGLAVGITGHRPPALDEEVEAAAHPIISGLLRTLADATAQLRNQHPALFDDAPFKPTFVSPLAEGADQFGAVVALENGYRLEAILPLPRDDYRQDFEPDGDARFQVLLDRADRILELPPQASGRDESYALAGRATVAHCDILIALWDGAPARGSGGTADVVSLALRRGVPVIHLNPQMPDGSRILWTGFSEFVDATDMESMPQRDVEPRTLHDLVQAIIGPPADPRTQADLYNYLGEREKRLRTRIEYPMMLALLGVKRPRASTFVSAPYEEATRGEWRPLHQACEPELKGVAEIFGEVETSFAWADRLAQHYAQIYRSGHVLNFTFAAAAVLLALLGLTLPQYHFVLAVAEPTVIAIFVANTFLGSKRQWHRRWLEYRQLAERLRPMRSLKLLGVASPPSSERQGVRSQDGWIDWYARSVWRAAGCPSAALTNARSLGDTIAREELRPQVAYNTSNSEQMHKLDHRLHVTSILLFAVTIIGCVTSVVVNLFLHDPEWSHNKVFVIVAAGLPAIGAAIFGIRMQGDFGSTEERSRGTADNLKRIADALEHPDVTLARSTDLVEAAAATMLSDVSEWRQAYQKRTLQLG